ncbi:MAG: hypothetical protein P8107_13925 [Spirochaetia bacterium]|jgi:DnaJ-class molecular chaperone
MMGKYEQILGAMKMFGLNEHETMAEIKRKINILIKQWHPDTARKQGRNNNDKAIAVIKAREILMNYLDNYKISFEKTEIEKYLSPQEQWMRQFGNDHIWGNGT